MGSRSELSVMIVIPARLESQRLPRKLLLRETGKPLVQHTFQAALRSRWAQRVVVATDSRLIADEVAGFGGEAVMTDPAAASGTDRVAEVAAGHPEFDIFVNLQGDEPEVEADHLDRVVELLAEDAARKMATIAVPIVDRDEWADPACVKVVLDHQGRALYFSRSPIPFVRDADRNSNRMPRGPFLRHVGLYAYRRDFLIGLSQLPPSELEGLEKLEQLRVLAAGEAIYVAIVPQAAPGIDTPADYQAFVTRIRGR